jgi:translation initiation factor IF-2
MNNTTDDKPKKLTLGTSKLSLNKPIDSSGITKTFVNSRSNTIIEVKKSKVASSSLSLNKISGLSNRDGETNSEDFNKRLNVLKKAAEEARSKEPDLKFSSLSKLAAMNQSKSVSEEENLPEDNNQEPIALDTKLPITEVNKTFTAAPASFEEDDEIAQKKKLTDNKVAPAKPKLEEPKKLKKTDILHMLDSDVGDVPIKTRSLASIKRAREKERRKAEPQKQEKVYREVVIPETISVGELSNRMAERGADVIRELMKLGIIANTSQSIDADTAELIVGTFGHTSKRIQESDIENILIDENDIAENLKPRAPVVTVMGHVDHGKTSLLDALKSSNIVSGEAGGITQHIGAYRVSYKDNRAITFIDTPGHEAFTEMRTRGAQVTDIVVLVVAADDGIKKQTIEAISHAKAAGVPIIVAINKIDKPDINIDRVKNELLNYELISEDLGGDTIIIPVSALARTNLDKLVESILLVAEMQDLRANPNANASGTVIESRMDKGTGVVATILVRRGTLKVGDLVVAGSAYGRIKRMNNDKGMNTNNVMPSEPVEVYGLNEAPQAGDKFDVVQTEKQARDITEYRDRMVKEKKVSITKRASLEDLFLKAAGNETTKELPVIIKGDVHGSIEAISSSLLKLPNDEIKLKILHNAVGGITESDVGLAKASNAIILGFNVRANSAASLLADREKVDMRYYSIIYNLIDDIKAVMSGMLAPIIREQYIGSVEIREVFNVSKVGKIAGCYVTKGVIKRGAGVRLLREDVVIHEGKLKTLKRFKEEVKEVKENYECGIAFENYEDIKIGDSVEVFEIIEEKKQLL